MLAAAASLVLAGCAARDSGGSSASTGSAAAPSAAANAANPAGDGKAVCSHASIAYIGAITGNDAAIAVNSMRGADLAVKQHNAANPNCQVAYKTFDTQGLPDKAPGVVTQAISEPDILGVDGLPYSGESKAVGNLFNQAGLVSVTPIATNPGLAQNGWKTFFRAIGNDSAQGPAAVKLMTDTLKAQKICVIQDDSEFGVGLAAQVIQALGAKATCTDKVKTGQTDFSAVVNKLATANPDAVMYAGYYPEAAPLAQQMNDKGITAKFVGPDGVMDPAFVKGAGAGADNAYFTCPCVPQDSLKDFTDAYQKQEGTNPGTYSAEGYDVATILLKGIDSGVKDRAGMLNFVKTYDGQGLTKHYKWDAKGELSDTPVWSYRVVNGQIVNNGELS
jgi:branched-chain amino acid transport system substrate-binding protein